MKNHWKLYILTTAIGFVSFPFAAYALEPGQTPFDLMSKDKCKASPKESSADLINRFRDTILFSEIMGEYSLIPTTKGYSKEEVRKNIENYLKKIDELDNNGASNKKDEILLSYNRALQEIFFGDNSTRINNHPENMTIELKTKTDSDGAYVRMEEFLKADTNTNLEWLSINCVYSEEQDDTNNTEKMPTFFEKLRITKNKDGAKAEEKDKLDFAEISYTDDHISSTKSTNLEIAILAPLGKKASGGWNSYIYGQWQRQDENKKIKLDDLTFGISTNNYTSYKNDFNLFFHNSISWETDSRFRSSVWLAESQFIPMSTKGLLGNFNKNLCTHYEKSTQMNANCMMNILGVLDYSYVENEGSKSELADINNFARIGFDFNAFYTTQIEDAGNWEFGINYKNRHGMEKRRGNADLFEAYLKYLPADSSNISIALIYTKGKDLTSLEKQEKIAITFGLRKF